MVKKYTAQLAQKLHLTASSFAPLGQLLPFLFLVAVLITNTVAWLKGAVWHYSVMNAWLWLAWLAATLFIYRKTIK